MWLHEGFVAWAKSEGTDLNKLTAAEVIAFFAAKRNEFRASSFYDKLLKDNGTARKGTAKPKAATKKAAAAPKKAPAKKAAKKAAPRKGAKPAAEENLFD